MNKSKTWGNRIFLNPFDKSCTAVLSWSVTYYPGGTRLNTVKGRYKPEIECYLTGSDGLSMYFGKPRIFAKFVSNLRAELNKFEQAKEEAYAMAEEWKNAQSQE